jgi:hypothetical protein
VNPDRVNADRANPDRPTGLDPADTMPLQVVVPEPRTPDDPAPVGCTERPTDAAGQFTPNPWRRRAADRLTLAGRRHARHLTDLAGTAHRPGPHALIFLHREPDPHSNDPASGAVRIATRMFLHGRDVTDLHTILTELHARALEYAQAGVRHPIAQLADTAEPMTRAAHYLGIAASTIDPTGFNSPGSWPWTGLAQLTDGTRMVIRATSSVETPDLQSSHTLDAADRPTGVLDAFNPARAWRWTRPDLTLADNLLGAEQDALDALHTFLHTTETAPRPHRHARHHPADA